MATTSKKRQAASSIKIDPNVRCLRIYPVEDNRNSTKTIADLKTVGSSSRPSRLSTSLVSCLLQLRNGTRSISLPGVFISVSQTGHTTSRSPRPFQQSSNLAGHRPSR
jgi:hypothetical protein